MVQKSLRILTRILTSLGIASLLGIVAVIVVNVLARKLFNRPILWSLEMCSILVVWSTYILFGVDYHERKHFRIPVIIMLLPKRMRVGLELFVDIMLFIAVTMLSLSNWQAIQMNGSMTLTAMPVSLLLAFYLPFTIGLVSHLLYIIVRISSIFMGTYIPVVTDGEVDL